MARTATSSLAYTAINVPAARPPSSLRPSSSASPPSTETSGTSTPDYDDYDSPPTPVTIEDQLFEAYVAEDIITAKRLLLRLKGIEVTSDDDPRIAEVQDEDFDFCFVPNGGLKLEPEHEKAIQDAQRQWERQERLRACEMKWENEKRRMREERMAVVKAREMKWQEEERHRRRRAEKEARRLSQDERSLRDEQRHTTSRSQRRVLTASLLGGGPLPRRTHDSDRAGPSSAPYDFMSCPPRNHSSRVAHEDRAPLRSRSHHDIPLATQYPHIQSVSVFDDTRAVPFSDVVNSMHGTLFPVTNEERRSRARRKESPSPSTSRPRTSSQAKRIRENELLQCLLDGIDEIATPDVKGKGKAIHRPRRLNTSELCAACKRSPSSPPSAASSSSLSSPTSGRISWLSFRTSSSSVSTAATTPSSSPGWFKSSYTPRRQSSWLSTRSSQSSLSHDGDTCGCLRKSLIPIDMSESPLAPVIPTASKVTPYAASSLRRNPGVSEGAVTAKELVHVVSSTVSHFLEIVHGFQQAYVTAAQFSVAASGDGWEERSFSFIERADGTREVRYAEKSISPSRATLPPTCRVSVKDVANFLSAGTDCTFIDNTQPEDPRAVRGFRKRNPLPEMRYLSHIQLLTREEAEQEPLPPPSTVLPNPLPYKLHFKPLPKPAQSPRCLSARIAFETAAAQAESDDAMPACTPVVFLIPVRARAVANPQFWRIKAALNATKQCQKRSALPRPLGISDPKVTHLMGAGWEGMKGFAYEGIGHSPLSLSSCSVA